METQVKLCAGRLSYFVVLCNGTKAEALAMKEELKEFLSTKGLTLSEEKTKITHITEGFKFLGYQIIREIGQRPSIRHVDRVDLFAIIKYAVHHVNRQF